jgi:hypothetical protein
MEVLTVAPADLLTVEEAADRLRIGRTSMYRKPSCRAGLPGREGRPG